MRLVIQRVSQSKVMVPSEPSSSFAEATEDRPVGEIARGVLVLVGVRDGGDFSAADALAEKLARLRIMADAEGKMNLSIKDSGASVLAVSQFTLYADMSKGNRPSFLAAGDPEKAKAVYERFVSKLRELGVPTETGSFGSYMSIPSELDGPVTIILERV